MEKLQVKVLSYDDDRYIELKDEVFEGYRKAGGWILLGWYGNSYCKYEMISDDMYLYLNSIDDLVGELCHVYHDRFYRYNGYYGYYNNDNNKAVSVRNLYYEYLGYVPTRKQRKEIHEVIKNSKNVNYLLDDYFLMADIITVLEGETYEVTPFDGAVCIHSHHDELGASELEPFYTDTVSVFDVEGDLYPCFTNYPEWELAGHLELNEEDIEVIYND